VLVAEKKAYFCNATEYSKGLKPFVDFAAIEHSRVRHVREVSRKGRKQPSMGPAPDRVLVCVDTSEHIMPGASKISIFSLF
jgi:hypothetical protein